MEIDILLPSICGSYPPILSRPWHFSTGKAHVFHKPAQRTDRPGNIRAKRHPANVTAPSGTGAHVDVAPRHRDRRTRTDERVRVAREMLNTW